MTVRAGIGMKLRCLLAILLSLVFSFYFQWLSAFMLLRKQVTVCLILQIGENVKWLWPLCFESSCQLHVERFGCERESKEHQEVEKEIILV